MPDFDARFTGSTTLEVWSDPPLGDSPSRINPYPEHPLRYRQVLTGDVVEFSAVVGGVEGPLDSALAGRLFYGWMIECPTPTAVPPVTSPPGQSSVVSFTPSAPGHYTYMMRRRGGGGIILHVDAIDFEGG